MDRDKRLQEIIDNRMIYYFGGLDIEISEEQRKYVLREAEEIYSTEKALNDIAAAARRAVRCEPLIEQWRRSVKMCERILNKKEG